MMWAYIDPASGSIIFQVVIAGMLSAGVAFRHYLWRPIAAACSLFSGKSSD